MSQIEIGDIVTNIRPEVLLEIGEIMIVAMRHTKNTVWCVYKVQEGRDCVILQWVDNLIKIGNMSN